MTENRAPSIHDVARATGLAVSTVSRALRGVGQVSPATRTVVKQAADELGYIPSTSAAGLATGRHYTVAVVVPTLARWFYTEVIAGIEQVLREAGYDILLIDIGGQHGERERLFHRALLRRRVDAVLALAYKFTPAERAELVDLDVPVCSIGGRTPGVRSIGIDDTAAGTLAVNMLLSLGHRRIAHIGGTDRAGFNDNVPSLREAAWRDTLARNGIEVQPSWLADGGFSLPQGFSAASELFDAENAELPTAVFCASDEIAFGVILAAHQRGIRVPEDLSVVGIDDHPHSATYGLSTVRQEPKEQGRLAAQQVLDEIGGAKRRTRSMTADIRYVSRASTAAPRATDVELSRRRISPRGLL